MSPEYGRASRRSVVVAATAIAVVVATRHVAAEDASAGVRLDPGWTRSGPLNDVPARTTPTFPLSDQANRGAWRRVDALTDEFDGPAPDVTRWFLTNETWHGRTPFAFDPANVSVRGGELVLLASAAATGAEAARLPAGYTHTAAFVRTREAFRYGYVEIRAKLAPTTVNSCFFLMDTTADASTEIDVFEIAAADQLASRRVGMSRHVMRLPGFTPPPGKHLRHTETWEAPESLANGHHVFGVEWSDAAISWFVDGVLVHRARNDVHHYPIRIILDLEPNQAYEAAPMERLLPAEFRIDYVRTWTRDTATTR